MKRKASSQRYARKKRRLSTKRSITRVVKSVVNKVAETKHRLDSWNYNLLAGDTRMTNLFAGIAAGTGDTQRIGNKISIKGVSIKMILLNALSSVTTTLHYAIVASDDEYLGANNAVTAADYIKNTSADFDNWRVDPERCKVLKRGKIISRDYIGSTAEKKSYRAIYKKMNLTFTFNPASGYSRDKNYYLLYWAGFTAGGLSTIRGIFDSEIYFKDI